MTDDVPADRLNRILTAVDTIEESLRILDYNKDELPVDGSYPFYRFKLEESRFHLRVMSEATLAWLKMSQRLYYDGRDEGLLREVKGHLKTLEELQRKTETRVGLTYHGRDHYLIRGTYLDIDGFLELFRKHWQME